MSNVRSIENQRMRRNAYEQQRQRAAKALQKAAAEFRKLEELEERRA